ncbi:hypothetical protein CHH28_07210 [Bacterioplanes sanyensis]|uniref:peptidylprolyl isomerase n=1 Tax=Bacterioplanes sanyensis TaxID=1249553 RepID=A0A222FJQ9_9GAMM|nr:peptidylprolyl isomerase [Bacterioplanes sanyensis]ASP38473.1 hypothetical protein CHH28_07210 [Bacterioplanes sanyensis]
MALWARGLLALLLSFSATLAQAQIDYQLQDDELIAKLTLAQQPPLLLSKTLIDVFVQHQRTAAQARGQSVTARLVVQQLLDNALLAAHVQQQYNEQQLWPHNRVGFDYAVERQRQRVSLLRGYYSGAIEAAVKALPGASLAAITQWQLPQDPLAAFALKPGLSIALTEAQRQQAISTPVLSIDLNQDGQADEQLSVWDLYQRQNVQGRLAIQQGDIGLLKAQARQWVGERFIEHYAQQRWSARDWQALEQTLINQQLATRLRQLVGVYADIHDDNPALRSAAEQVSDAQLQQAYDQHRDDFKVVERVKVKRIQLASQQQADDVYQRIQQGMAFDVAAQQFSQQSEVDLGWLQRDDEQRGWLHTVAFTQPQGAVSRPFRSPQSTSPVVFEILLIEAREEGYLPLSDAGVRYELAREIATHQLLHDYQELQQRLRRQAQISLNQRLQQS